LVKEVCGDRFLNIGAEFLPRVALSENVVAETLGDETTIRFLVDGEDDFH